MHQYLGKRVCGGPRNDGKKTENQRLKRGGVGEEKSKKNAKQRGEVVVTNVRLFQPFDTVTNCTRHTAV